VVLGPCPPQKFGILERENINFKFLPFQIPTGVSIFDDKISHLILNNDPKDFRILSSNHPSFVKTIKTYFETMWNTAQECPKCRLDI
jgi:hypothetical protein